MHPLLDLRGSIPASIHITDDKQLKVKPTLSGKILAVSRELAVPIDRFTLPCGVDTETEFPVLTQ